MTTETNQAAEALRNEELKRVVPLTFIPITEYTTFSAEVAVTEGDLVYHFFATDEVNRLPNPQEYWTAIFPAMLDRVAQTYFNATTPRLKAAYTPEKASWWMRAYGFGMVLDPHKRAYGLFDPLDEALEAEIQKLT